MGGAASGCPQGPPANGPANRQRWRKAAAGGCTNPAGLRPFWGGVTAVRSCPRQVPLGGQAQGGLGTSRAPCPDLGACSSAGVLRCHGLRTPRSSGHSAEGGPSSAAPPAQPSIQPHSCTGQGPLWGRGEGTGHRGPAWADPQGLGGAALGGQNLMVWSRRHGISWGSWGADPGGLGQQTGQISGCRWDRSRGSGAGRGGQTLGTLEGQTLRVWVREEAELGGSRCWRPEAGGGGPGGGGPGGPEEAERGGVRPRGPTGGESDPGGGGSGAGGVGGAEQETCRTRSILRGDRLRPAGPPRARRGHRPGRTAGSPRSSCCSAAAKRPGRWQPPPTMASSE